MGFNDYHSGIDGVCIDCKERYPACHDSCEKYLEAKGSFEDRKQRIREAREEAMLYDRYKKNKINAERKKFRSR